MTERANTESRHKHPVHREHKGKSPKDWQVQFNVSGEKQFKPQL